MYYVQLFIFGGVLLILDTGLAYEQRRVSDGGHLSGTVHLVEHLAQPRRYNLVVSPDPYFCGRISDGKGWRLSPTIQLGPNRGVKGVMIYIEKINSGKPIDVNSHPIKAKDCRFLPAVSVIPHGKMLTLENWDPVQHKLELYQATSNGGRLLFVQDLKQNPETRKSDFLVEGNLGKYRPGQPVRYELREDGRLVFRCSYHEYMEGWGMVLDHPYYSVTGDGGVFTITDIPPGSYTFRFWHPLGQLEKKIQIWPQQTVDVDLEFRTRPSTIYPEKAPKPNPFGIDLIGDRHILPTVELQTWPALRKD